MEKNEKKTKEGVEEFTRMYFFYRTNKGQLCMKNTTTRTLQETTTANFVRKREGEQVEILKVRPSWK